MNSLWTSRHSGAGLFIAELTDNSINDIDSVEEIDNCMITYKTQLTGKISSKSHDHISTEIYPVQSYYQFPASTFIQPILGNCVNAVINSEFQSVLIIIIFFYLQLN